MKNFACMLLAVPILLPSSSAFAHWQYTRFGMTPSEVVASSSGKARLYANLAHSESGHSAMLAIGSFQSGEYLFETHFYFVADRLTEVGLDLKNGSCASLKDDLTYRYGNPISSNRIAGLDFTSLDWIDRSGANKIQFSISPSGCSVSYSALISINPKNREGL